MIRKILLSIFFVLLVLYVLFQGRYFVLGPKVVVDYPKSGSSVSSGTIEVSGKAINTSTLHINGRLVFTDQNGLFKEKLIAHEGNNIIEFKAKDRFGREKTEILRVVGQ
jgi:Glucodextranase, domain B